MSLRFLTHPIIAGFFSPLVFSFWHVGVFYEAAIRDKVIHMAEHLSMFFVSLLMWWPICAPSDRLPSIRFGPQMLYILALMLGQTPIFAILTFSKDVLYDTYFYAERIMELNSDRGSKSWWRPDEACQYGSFRGCPWFHFLPLGEKSTGNRQGCLRSFRS